jgi:hypothetical protein
MIATKPAHTDVHRTLEYDHLHSVAINMLPIGLVVCLFGLYMLTPLDGAEIREPRAWLAVGLGAFIALFSLAAFRRPNKPSLSLSVDGIAYWPITEQPIPWSEVQRVETEKYVPSREFFSHTFAVIVVSKEFYERINGSYFGLSNYVDEGPLVRIRILHHHLSGVSLGELYEAIVLRWQVFGNPPQDAVPPARRTSPFARARAAAAARAAAYADIAALRPLRPSVSPLRFWLSLLPVLGIAVLLANHAGLWSTQAQRDARHAAELDAQKWAEMRRFGEEASKRVDQLHRETAESWRRHDAYMRQFIERERQPLREQVFAAPAQAVRPGGHREAVLALAVTPDGRSFVSAGGDHAVKLWDLARSSAPRDLGAHKAIVRSVHVIDGGTHALSAGDDGEIVLRALSDGRILHVFREAGRGDVAALAVSADGRRAVSVYDKGGGSVWSLSSRIMLQPLDSEGMRMQAVAISPDGGRAVGGGADGMLRLWDMSSGKLLRTFGSHQGPVYGVAFLPDGGRAVSAGGDSTLRLWDLETGKEIRSFTGHTDTVYGVAVSNDGKRILSGSLDRTARLWDSEAAAEVARFSGHEAPVYAVTFAKDGTILTGSRDRSIRLWNASGGEPVRVFAGASD